MEKMSNKILKEIGKWQVIVKLLYHILPKFIAMFRAELSPQYLKHRFRIKLNYPECLENERGYILILTKTKVSSHSSLQ